MMEYYFGEKKNKELSLGEIQVSEKEQYSTDRRQQQTQKKNGKLQCNKSQKQVTLQEMDNGISRGQASQGNLRRDYKEIMNDY